MTSIIVAGIVGFAAAFASYLTFRDRARARAREEQAERYRALIEWMHRIDERQARARRMAAERAAAPPLPTQEEPMHPLVTGPPAQDDPREEGR